MSDSKNEGPYYILGNHLMFKRRQAQEVQVARLDQEIGIAYDEDGVLLKHGEAQSVRDYVALFDKTLAVSGLDVGAIVLTMPITEEVVAEINSCLAITGRVLTLQSRLGNLAPPMSAIM